MRRITELRQALGWSQKDLAGKIGIYPSAISKYELGTVEPSTAVLIKLSQVFNVSIDYLVENTDDPARYQSRGRGVDYAYKLGSDGSSETIEINQKEMSRLIKLLQAYSPLLLGKDENDGR